MKEKVMGFVYHKYEVTYYLMSRIIHYFMYAASIARSSFHKEHLHQA